MRRPLDHERARELNARDRSDLALELDTAAVLLEELAAAGMPVHRAAQWLRDEAARWRRQ